MSYLDYLAEVAAHRVSKMFDLMIAGDGVREAIEATTIRFLCRCGTWHKLETTCTEAS